MRTRAATSPADVTRLRRVLAPTAPRTGPSGESLTVRRAADLLATQLRPWRLATTLFLVLGALGLTAAAAGIYGLVTYDVTPSTRERGAVMGATLRVVLRGVAAGVVLAAVAGRVIAALLYATSPYDPGVFAGTAATLALVTLLAGGLPAWRATRVSPAVALAAD